MTSGVLRVFVPRAGAVRVDVYELKPNLPRALGRSSWVWCWSRFIGTPRGLPSTVPETERAGNPFGSGH